MCEDQQRGARVKELCPKTSGTCGTTSAPTAAIPGPTSFPTFVPTDASEFDSRTPTVSPAQPPTRVPTLVPTTLHAVPDTTELIKRCSAYTKAGFHASVRDVNDADITHGKTGMRVHADANSVALQVPWQRSWRRAEHSD